MRRMAREEKLMKRDKPNKGTPAGDNTDLEKRKAELRAKLEAFKEKLKPEGDKGTPASKRESEYEEVLDERACKRREAPKVNKSKDDDETVKMTRFSPW